MKKFNPENIQADCSEFMTSILDQLHEEMRDIYVSNQEKDGGYKWNETKVNGTVNNFDAIHITHSIVSDIFAGHLRTEFHVDGTRTSSVKIDPFFVLSLDIHKDECTIEDCLDRYFEQ